MRFRTIVGTLFLYDGDLISSGLDMEPTRLLYSFLSDHLFGEPARPLDLERIDFAQVTSTICAYTARAHAITATLALLIALRSAASIADKALALSSLPLH